MVWFRLDRMDKIREFNAILNEKYGDVIANQVKVALLGIELDCEAAHVSREVCRTPGPHDGRESHEDRRLHRGILEKSGLRVRNQRLVHLKKPMGRRPAGVHDPLRDALMVKMRDLLTKV